MFLECGSSYSPHRKAMQAQREYGESIPKEPGNHPSDSRQELQPPMLSLGWLQICSFLIGSIFMLLMLITCFRHQNAFGILFFLHLIREKNVLVKKKILCF
ncbi:hypothetical protein CHARACLAT_014080 [Characodon lateralis]|uniref:Uncharacterized protein n=1 Tax=Characodon lateralis TaxID=208331 RepID=A0ABU7F454_9TELE|nr:hypothetical protein [Characodon lateralis]